MNMTLNLRLLTLLAGTSMATAAFPTALTGTVHDPSGKPKEHAFVTAEDGARKMAITVLSDAGGHYRIADLLPGHYAVHARMTGYADSAAYGVSLEQRDSIADLKLQKDDGSHLSTPGAAWLSPLTDSPMKATFITQCTICHDQGSVLAHVPRDEPGWESIINQMRNQTEAYASLVSKDPKPLATWLAEQKYGTKSSTFEPFAPNANVVTAARITEYSVGDAITWAHDVVVDPNSGLAWVGDYVNDNLISVDPATGEQAVYPAPLKGTGMHTLSFDRDGNLWITLQLVAQVARFNTKTHEWRLYGGWTTGSLNHSFALDSEGYVKKDPKGRLYVSLWGGDRTSLLDPSTGEIKEFRVSGNPYDKPYGIAVDSRGVIWYTKYTESMLGFIDPNTGKGREWPMQRPDSGPHRMHIDDDDNLWIPLSGYASVLRYNTRDGSQQEFLLPDRDCFPYAVRYDSKSKRVWITGNGGNAIYALDPKTGKFSTFRMPSPLSYGRMVAIDYNTGDIWTGLASYPNKLSLRDHSIIVRIHHALAQVN